MMTGRLLWQVKKVSVRAKFLFFPYVNDDRRSIPSRNHLTPSPGRSPGASTCRVCARIRARARGKRVSTAGSAIRPLSRSLRYAIGVASCSNRLDTRRTAASDPASMSRSYE